MRIISARFPTYSFIKDEKSTKQLFAYGIVTNCILKFELQKKFFQIPMCNVNNIEKREKKTQPSEFDLIENANLYRFM